MTDESDERIVEEYQDPESGETLRHGQRVRILTDEQEDQGLYADDEGKLHICEVGAEEYHNLRTAVYFHGDDMDEPVAEVALDNFELLDD